MSTGDYLNVHPSELQFQSELEKQSSCSMQLTNKTDQYIAFKVKTTNRMKYCARPNTGIVLPRSVCDVTVTMQAQNEAPVDTQCKDKFLLQAVLAPNGTTINDLTAEMFNKEENKVIEEFKLTAACILANPPSPGADSILIQPLSISVNNSQKKDMHWIKGPWSPEEDEMLLNLFEKHGPGNWSLIGKSIPGRTRTSCMSRWLSLQRSFTPGEDEMLQNLVKKHGPSWSLISKSIPGTSDQSCRSKWLSLQFVSRPFTPEEDETILRAQAHFGNKWEAIGYLLSGRTGDVIENHWNLTLKWKSSLVTDEDIIIASLMNVTKC